MHESMILGRFFYWNRIRTFVDNFFASGCAIAFMGGTDRVTGNSWREKTPMAKLGVHRSRPDIEKFVFGDKLKLQHLLKFYLDAQRVVNAEIQYLDEMQVSLDFLRYSMKTPAKQMYFFTNEEAAKLGVRIAGKIESNPTIKRNNDAGLEYSGR